MAELGISLPIFLTSPHNKAISRTSCGEEAVDSAGSLHLPRLGGFLATLELSETLGIDFRRGSSVTPSGRTSTSMVRKAGRVEKPLYSATYIRLTSGTIAN